MAAIFGQFPANLKFSGALDKTMELLLTVCFCAIFLHLPSCIVCLEFSDISHLGMALFSIFLTKSKVILEYFPVYDIWTVAKIFNERKES